MEEIIFVGLVSVLTVFFLYFLPKRNVSVSSENMIKISDGEPEPWKLCEEFHRSAWEKLERPLFISPTSYNFICPVCERYR
jgi:hypothetical protein